jgi:hypothetical protein
MQMKIIKLYLMVNKHLMDIIQWLRMPVLRQNELNFVYPPVCVFGRKACHRIPTVSVQNPAWLGYLKAFCGFSKFFEVNVTVIPSNRPRPLLI